MESRDRMRTHPEERFAGTQHQFDLDTVATRLRHEQRAGVPGHRQETLYKHGATTLAFFIFAANTRLRQHRASGTVIIHLLKGHITVMADGQQNDLTPGGIVVLASGVPHDVVADEESEMLLTVHLDSTNPVQ